MSGWIVRVFYLQKSFWVLGQANLVMMKKRVRA